MELIIGNEIKPKLIEYKENTGIKFSQVAKDIGWSRQQLEMAYRNTTNDIGNMTIGTLAKIATALNCKIDDLISIKEIEK